MRHTEPTPLNCDRNYRQAQMESLHLREKPCLKAKRWRATEEDTDGLLRKRCRNPTLPGAGTPPSQVQEVHTHRCLLPTPRHIINISPSRQTHRHVNRQEPRKTDVFIFCGLQNGVESQSFNPLMEQNLL